MLAEKQIIADLIFLQEIFFAPDSLQAMTHKLNLAGYRMWATTPSQVGGQYRGGAALITKATFRASLHSTYAARAGEAVARTLPNLSFAQGDSPSLARAVR